MQPPPDRAALAGRIQGFGNVNPPPLEEETGATMAKRAVGRLGDMVGEEVMLTVEDFKEKGAVGAVKDAVADAGDILIDGVSGIIGWIRGDPPPEDENEAAEDANKALSNGPSGAAYGIQQASPTGGINAVWVMPDEADPSTLAQLQHSGGLAAQQADPRVPKNIQPYQAPPKASAKASAQYPQMPTSVPGGPAIAPYQPMSAPGRPAPFVPGALPGMPGAAAARATAQGEVPRWGPAGYTPGASSGSGASASASTGPKALVERVAKGDVLLGPDTIKRLVSQCQAAKTTSKQLGEMICERCRRLYLGLDGGDPAEADASLERLLALSAALLEQESPLARGAVQEIKTGVSEELLSLRSSAKHKGTAEPLLRQLGLVEGGAQPSVDLLGGAAAAGSGEADLLGGVDAAAPADGLLGGATSSSPAAVDPVAILDPLGPSAAAPSSLGGLDGLRLDATTTPGIAAPSAPAVAAAAPMVAPTGTLAAGATLVPDKKDADPFGFVGGELSKAGAK